MANPRLVVIDGVRTPFCRAGGELASLGADELGRTVADTLLVRTGLDPALLDEVIFGCVSQPADQANVARTIALDAGVPESVPTLTVDRQGASGLEAVTLAANRLAAGQGGVFLVGGTESASRVPLLFREPTARKFAALAKSKTPARKLAALSSFRPWDFEPRASLKLGPTNPVSGLSPGENADQVARESGLSREAQDALALRSHHRVREAQGRLAEEICPVYHDGLAVIQDQDPHGDTSAAILAGLRPLFDKYGTVTAGNSAPAADGAAALLVMDEARAAELGFPPMGALIAWAVAGCDPARPGSGPLLALERLSRQCGLRVQDADLVEIHEAFAAQVLAVLARLPVSDDQLNVNGGALALGDPLAASGPRLILGSLRELARREARRALILLSDGAGQGAALWLERTP